jgi:hypothetical protein
LVVLYLFTGNISHIILSVVVLIRIVYCIYPLCHYQGFQSGPVPGTFTRLRLCIVPAEITEPPKISGGQNHKYDWRVEYFS